MTTRRLEKGVRDEELASPRKHDLGELRVMARESELARFMERFPGLTREEVLEAIRTAGPLRSQVEAELQRLSSERS